ncbi:hypothetical protein NUW54_g1067 [Trametes sanguinea]|uniref:Uncharacterized protein n=1 Tax=Trametes sanguinea TaxID=158606 RepID=A0ACC1Q8V6_9APHY|nr:hypothetical protein NUW54_g1067 [Trametes sanguinea]
MYLDNYRLFAKRRHGLSHVGEGISPAGRRARPSPKTHQRYAATRLSCVKSVGRSVKRGAYAASTSHAPQVPFTRGQAIRYRHIGSVLVGTFLTTLLVGMLMQQTFRYFRLYPSDPSYMKAWRLDSFSQVVLAVILQLVTTALIMHTSYYYLVTYYLNPIVFTKPDVWTSAVVPVFGSINNLVCERSGISTFVRVRLLSRPDGLLAVPQLLRSPRFHDRSSLQDYCSICDGHDSRKLRFTLHNVVSSSEKGGWLPTVGSALLLAGDVQLTGVLVYVLHQGRSGIKRTDSMVDILIAYAVSSGSIICLAYSLTTSYIPPPRWSLNPVCLSVCPRNRTIYDGATTPTLPPVYTNSFVVALNTRDIVRSRGELDNTNLDTGIVLGEGPSGTVVNRVEVPLTSMVFAHGATQSQFTEAGNSESDAATAAMQDDKAKTATPFSEARPKERPNFEKHGVNVLATV